MEKKQIEEIIEGIEENWLASDGGLTAAACDVCSFGRSVIRAIERKDVKWLWSMDSKSSTGAEMEITDLGFAAARRIARRQIEDRLRKDPKFLVKIIDTHLDRPRVQFHEAEGPGKFYQLSIKVDSWDNIPDQLIRNFGERNTDGELWLSCMPLNFNRE
jgi:hypothetical protein